MQVLLLHKFRRAPYGGGRFWNGLKQVLAMFLEAAHREHPLFELLGESICNDYGTTLAANNDDCRPLLKLLLAEAKGPRVECRRWFTIYDAGRRLVKLWHSMLLAMMVWFLAEGNDPWAVMAETRQATDDDADDFEFKTQALVTLGNTMHQKLLTSQLVVFREIWTEHKTYSSIATSPSSCLVYWQRWASFDRWANHKIMKTLEDAFVNSGELDRMGLEKGTSAAAWPSSLGFQVQEQDESQTILLAHIQLAASATFQMLLYGFIPQSPPWCFSLLLMPNERNGALAGLRAVWDLRNFLDSSRDPDHLVLRKAMPFLDWAVVTEVLELFNLAEWKFDGPWAQKAMACIEATFGGALALVA